MLQLFDSDAPIAKEAIDLDRLTAAKQITALVTQLGGLKYLVFTAVSAKMHRSAHKFANMLNG